MSDDDTIKIVCWPTAERLTRLTASGTVSVPCTGCGIEVDVALASQGMIREKGAEPWCMRCLAAEDDQEEIHMTGAVRDELRMNGYSEAEIADALVAAREYWAELREAAQQKR